MSEFVEVKGQYELVDYKVRSVENNQERCTATVRVGDNDVEITGTGSGPIDAFVAAMVETLNEPLNVMDYQEYSLNEGSQAQAICILSISDESQNKFYGVGISQNTTTAAFKSIIAAINRRWK